MSSLNVKGQGLINEKDEAFKEELKRLDKEISDLEEEFRALKQRWDQEKRLIASVKKKKNEIERLNFLEEEAERAADYHKVAAIRYNDLPIAKKEMKAAEDRLHDSENRLLHEELDENLIAEIVSKWTRIPVQKMLRKEADALLHLEEKLAEKVIGQEAAVQSVSDAIRRSRSGLNDPDRPTGVFLFLGPTGVGKTELAKALSHQMFNSEDAMIRLDMSEYMEQHSVAKLIGSPPGYVGYDEGGQLTEALRRRPYSIVLLDEIEKSHRDVFNILLQIFNDGRITDSKGRVINCKNALFIMASNLGSDRILEKMQSGSEQMSKQEILDLTEPAIKGHFRPEFINRLDEILLFYPLKMQHMENIVDIHLKQLSKRLDQKQVHLNWTPEILADLAKKGYDRIFGARPLKRLIQQSVVNMLSKAFLGDKVPAQSELYLVLRDGDLNFLVKKHEFEKVL